MTLKTSPQNGMGQFGHLSYRGVHMSQGCLQALNISMICG